MQNLVGVRERTPPQQSISIQAGSCSSRSLEPTLKPSQSFRVTDQCHPHPPEVAMLMLRAQMITQMASLPPCTARGLHVPREDKGFRRIFPARPASLHLSDHGDRVMLSPALSPALPPASAHPSWPPSAPAWSRSPCGSSTWSRGGGVSRRRARLPVLCTGKCI